MNIKTLQPQNATLYKGLINGEEVTQTYWINSDYADQSLQEIIECEIVQNYIMVNDKKVILNIYLKDNKVVYQEVEEI